MIWATITSLSRLLKLLKSEIKVGFVYSNESFVNAVGSEI